MKPPIVRPATPADVPHVLPMVEAICAMHDRLDPRRYAMLPDVVDRYARWLPERAGDPESVFLAAEDPEAAPGRPTGPLLGLLIATTETSIPIYRIDRFAFIHDVWVVPEARRRGVAGALVKEACRRFAALGVEQVRLETAWANGGARSLFEHCGFRPSTVEMLRPTAPPAARPRRRRDEHPAP